MNQIIATISENGPLTDAVYRMTLTGEGIRKHRPGQFVNIRLAGRFLRRPISVYDSADGALTVV